MTQPLAKACGNDEHPEPVPAVVRIDWPTGRFTQNTACRPCLDYLLELYVIPGPDLIEGPFAVTITAMAP